MPTRLRLALWALPLAVAAGLAAPAGASAAVAFTSVSVPGGEGVVDKPLTVTVAGTSKGRVALTVEINATGIPCSPTATANPGVKRVSKEATVAGFATGVTFDFQLSEPGGYSACAYGRDSADSAAGIAAAGAPLPVRQPRTSLSFRAPTRIPPGQIGQVSITTFAEVKRRAAVYLNPAGVPCAANEQANRTDGLFSLSILGGPTSTTRNFRAPKVRGQFRFCGYIARSQRDTTPLQVVDSGSFLVGSAPSRRCTIRRSAVRLRSNLRVTCTKAVTGQIRIRASYGGKRKSVLRTLVDKGTSVPVRELKLPRGVSTITVTKNGRLLCTKQVRRRG